MFNNRLLFSLLFSGNFCGGQDLDGGGESRDREDPPVPPYGKTLMTSQTQSCKTTKNSSAILEIFCSICLKFLQVDKA